MSANRRVALTFLAAVVVFSGLTYVLLDRLISAQFTDLEQQSVNTNIQRFHSAVQREADDVASFASDYAVWDDTYAFMDNRNREYIQQNFSDPVWLKYQRVDVILFIDSVGQFFWGTRVDDADLKEISLETGVPQNIVPSALLARPNRTGSQKGLISTPGGLMLFASQPILPNSGLGPSRGTLIIGRFLDEAAVDQISRVIAVAVVIRPLETVDEGPFEPPLSHSQDGVRVDFGPIHDFLGNPLALLEVTTQRRVVAIGAKTLNAAALAVVTAGVGLTGILFIVLNRLFLSPIAQLTQHIVKMQSSGNLNATIDVNRNDEIGTLAAQFNELTGSLDQSRQDLETARDKALKLSKTKGQFLATMSHEIRTPMNGVIGMTELLSATDLDESQRKFTRTISKSAQSLLAVINDILDFSKIEAGKMRLEKTPFDLVELIEDMVDMFASAAVSKGLALEQNVSKDIHPVFVGDPNRIRQILTNLISNAIKFTSVGQVIISASAVEGEGPLDKLLIEIQDQGIGIPPEKQKMIFDVFTQADGSTTREYGGTGLGLAICKQLAELMGGSIKLASQPGAGSTFSVLLPLERSADLNPATAPPRKRPPSSGHPHNNSERKLVRILLAEDNEVNQIVAEEMLSSIGYAVQIAANGQEALEAVLSAEYDLIMMDCQMPVLNGFDATRDIRSLETRTGRARTPIIAMTANAMPEDRRRCLEAGMDDYIAKPFTQNSLGEAIKRWCQSRQSDSRFDTA